eukprot:COSAG06_NODE_28561_length_572_cov_0.765328_2_plen_41_part_01
MFGDKPRGGSRGGKDRFNWDDVKNDEHRCAPPKLLPLPRSC